MKLLKLSVSDLYGCSHRAIPAECPPHFRDKPPWIPAHGSLRNSSEGTVLTALCFLDAVLTSHAVICPCVYVFAAGCCQANEQYIEQFKETLDTSVAKSIAGFFAEPIQVGIQT